MARKKNSTAADLMDLVALLPWWVGCAFAVMSYVLLHRVATQDVSMTTTPGQVGTAVSHAIWTALALVGQYVLPLLCLAGAAVSSYGRKKRKDLVATVTSSPAADILDGITWKEFELLVGEAFRLKGYQVTEYGGSGPDGGVDLVLRKGSEKYLVQCKQWKAFSVGVNIVRELYGVMAASGAAGGFVVTSGRFTKEASAFANGRNVKLLDGPRLHEMIKQARPLGPLSGQQGNHHV